MGPPHGSTSAEVIVELPLAETVSLGVLDVADRFHVDEHVVHVVDALADASLGLLRDPVRFAHGQVAVDLDVEVDDVEASYRADTRSVRVLGPRDGTNRVEDALVRVRVRMPLHELAVR